MSTAALPPRLCRRVAAPFAALACAALLLTAGCGEEGPGEGLFVSDGPDRSAAATLFLRGLARDLADEIGEGRTLRRLGFLGASPGRERLVRRYARLYDRIFGLRLEAADVSCDFDGERHLLRLRIRESGALAGGMLDYAAEYPVVWTFRAEGDRLTLADDGLARLCEAGGMVVSPDGDPLGGVAVTHDGRCVATSDDDGAFAALLPEGARGALHFSREGFLPAALTLAEASVETRLPVVTLRPLEGFFPPPVAELRAEPGNARVTLRFRLDRPADRLIVLRRADGPFEPVAELGPGAEEYVDRDGLVNGRRYRYRVIPFVGDVRSFADPTATAIPSAEIRRLEAESLLESPSRLRVKGDRPWVVKREGRFEDVFLAFAPSRTESLFGVPDFEFTPGRYAIFAHVRRDERGARFRLEIAQHGDPDPENAATFTLDTRARSPHRATLDLGTVSVRPVDWQSEPLPRSRYGLGIRSVPLTGGADRVILIDALEFIKISE